MLDCFNIYIAVLIYYLKATMRITKIVPIKNEQIELI